MIEKSEDFKNIINNRALKQYEQLKDCENYLNNNSINNEDIKNIGSELILFSTLQCLLRATIEAKKFLSKKKLIIFYNNIVYNIRKLLQITEKDEELEKAISLLKIESKTEAFCLSNLKDILIYLNTQPKINNISTVYLYYEVLMISQDVIDNHLEKLFIISDNNSKNINSQFNDETDIELAFNNVDKIKSLLIEYKNNQENS